MDIRAVSRYAGATCLVVGPLAITVAPAVYGEDDPVAQQLADIAARPGSMTASLVLGFFQILMVPAMLYAAHAARRGAPRLAAIGGTLSFFSWLAGLLSLNAIGVVLAVGARSTNHAAVATLVTDVYAHWAYTVLILLFVLGHIVGMLLLGLALWRSGVLPAWAGLIFAFASLAHAVARQFGPTADRVTFGLLTLTMIMLAVRVIRTPDDEWDLPARTPRVNDTPVAVATA